MRNFTLLLLISLLLFSCSKQNEVPGGSMGGSSGRTPAKPPAPPATKVTVTINDTAMNITSLSFGRHGDGNGGGMMITASNALQKVTAEVFHFYQNSPWDMMYQQEVSYFTRTDSLQPWGETYTRVVARDDGVLFDNFTPLSDSVVTGNFGASFNGPGSTPKEGKLIVVKGNFKLVFIQRR